MVLLWHVSPIPSRATWRRAGDGQWAMHGGYLSYFEVRDTQFVRNSKILEEFESMNPFVNPFETLYSLHLKEPLEALSPKIKPVKPI